jgi:lipopolysaccharide transport system permease protein
LRISINRWPLRKSGDRKQPNGSQFAQFPTSIVLEVTRELIIEPGTAGRGYWSDLWQYRDLFQALAWRDISVRYKQTVIGVAWALIRPLLTMVVFTVVFGKLLKAPTDGSTPYALMVYVGMLPWAFFSSSVTDAANCLIGNANLISKIYFPRLIIPAASIIVALFDFLISFVLLIAVMVWYRVVPGWQVVLLPIFVVLALALSLGLGAWVTALNVKYRDFRYVLPFAVQLGLYISPVGFSTSIVPDQWRLLYSINPMVGIIDGFRWCLLGGKTQLDVPGLSLSVLISIFLLAFGVHQFRRIEDSLADLI